MRGVESSLGERVGDTTIQIVVGQSHDFYQVSPI